MDQIKLTKGQELLELCISVVGTAKRVSELTGYREETISRIRNGHKTISKTGLKLFSLALEVGELKQENARLKRRRS